MKLTKKLQAEILKVYNTYWDAYLNGDMKTFASFLDDDITIIGTAVSEVFNNKEETLRFYKATADQLVGKAQFRNRQHKMKIVDETVLINEKCDFYFLLEKKWTFYGRARVTAILKQTKSGWKLVHQHASFPDTRAEEGEQVNTDKIKAENIQLRDAVRRRTEELEEKNRELEIETALEKVRSVAMGMKEAADMPGICKVIAEQLEILGLKETRNVQTVVFNRPTTVYLNYEYFPLNDKSVVTEVDYMLQPDVKAFAKRMLKASGTFYTKSFDRKELKEWSRYQKKANQYRDPRQQNAESLHYYFFSIENAALGISIFTELNKEEINVFKRFRNVFELAYKRFIDIQKAEAQAREAQIEVAVERVRAKALAMHRSEEISDVANVLRNELGNLNIPGIAAATITLQQENDKIRLWDITSVVELDDGFYFAMDFLFDLEETKPDDWIRRIWDSKEKYFVYKQDKKDFKRTLAWTSKYDPGFAKSAGLFLEKNNIKNSWHPVVPLSHGKLSLDILQEPIAEVEPILTKMGAAFDLAYKRFLDLKKAEAQAREAQVQLALERVRARSMAMHYSDEITDVVKLLYQEFDKLKINNQSTDIEIGLINEETGMAAVWAHLYLSDGTISTFNFPIGHFEGTIHEFKKWKATPLEKRNALFFTTEFKGKIWEKFKKWIKKFPELDEAFQPMIEANITQWITHNAYFSHGILTLQGTEPYSQETQDIQKRFTKVFEQTYIRFLDLKKAEAQAREAQIEAALERVRARTMAMHKSSDQLSVVKILGEQFELLGFKFDSVNFNTEYTEKDFKLWIYNSGSAMYPGQIHIPYIDHPCFNRVLEAFRKGADFQSFIFTKEEKDSFFDHIYTNSVAKYGSDERKRYTYAAAGMAMSVAVSKNTSVTVVNYDGRPFSDDENAILRRFATVFEQTYTRFLDLQKAEAQAREAQIEAALEKIRSRSLAMHQSKELKEVIAVLFEKLSELDVLLGTVAIQLFDVDSMNSYLWVGNRIQDPQMVYMPHDKKMMQAEGYVKDGWIAMREGKDIINKEYSFAQKNKFFKYVFANNDLTQIPEAAREVLRKMRKHIVCLFTDKNSALFVDSFNGQFFSKDSLAIIKRAGKVFEQCYIRFLDLQKAEAQAREAQIEAALERVRARTMGMHQSAELHDVIEMMTTQLLGLGLKFDNSVFCKINPDYSWELWMSTPQQSYPMIIHVPYIDHSIFNHIKEISKEVDFFNDVYDQQRAKAFFEHFFQNTIAKNVPEERKHYVLSRKGFARSGFLVKDIWFVVSIYEPVPFTGEDNSIIKRFAKVFEQSYTRFLDLQKAEAQAREAMIEAGLERVRSRAMAMQTSEELNELIGTVFTELTKLDLALTRCVIWVFDPATNEPRWWMANGEDPSHPMNFLINYHEHPAYLTFIEEWKKQHVKFVYDLKGQDKVSWDDILFNETELKNLPDVVKDGMRAPERVLLSASFNNFGGINAASLEPLSDEHFDILLRFAKVFDLTYTRFNDLKHAEAQAKESQIQLALERVRARTMAMLQSDELKEVAKELRVQLAALGTSELETCAINLYEEYDASVEAWAAVRPPNSPQQIFEFHFLLPKKGIYIIEDMVQQYDSGIDEYLFELTGEKGVQWMNTMSVLVPDMYSVAAATPEFKTTGQVQAWFFCAYFPGGALIMITMNPPLEEFRLLMKRFAKVFGLAYRRFTDLKKSEAQARESQIQLALERVRARSMAMQKSSELSDTAYVLFQQFKDLGAEADQFSIGVINEEEEVGEMYATIQGDQLLQKRTISIHEPIAFKKAYTAWKEKKENLVLEIKGKELETYNIYRNKIIGRKIFSEEIKDGDRWIILCSFFSKGVLSFASSEPPPDEILRLLERFAKVFDGTYTRFLDLQKAEAQAREAKIEAALERVRARSMGMQKSDELAEVVAVLYKQFEELDFGLYQVLVSIYNRKNNIIEWWSRGMSEKELPQRNIIPIIDHPFSNDLFEKWDNGIEYYPHILEGDLKKSWEEYLFTQTDLKNFPQEVKNAMRGFDKVYLSDVFMKYGSLQAAGPSPLPDDKAAILKRFVKVLDLAYTRMIDLQNAEAQGREAKIQLGLERVRARTMAMQNSDELLGVVSTLYEQLNSLQFDSNACNIIIIDKESNNQRYWVSGFTQKLYPESYNVPYFKHPYIDDQLQSWKEGRNYIVIEYSGKMKREFDKQFFSQTDFKNIPGEAQEFISALPSAKLSTAFFTYGALQIIGPNPLGEENAAILQRFAKVFDQTYTRFLDLQKAEAQAKEAKIEAALERVRSRAMAMHSSNELKDVALELRNQMGTMAQPELEVCAIQLYEESPDYFEAWAAVRPPDEDGKIIQVQAKFPKKGVKIVDEMMEAYHAGRKDYILVNEGEKVSEWLDQLRQQVPEGYEMVMKSLKGVKPEDTKTYWSIADFHGGSLVMTTYIPPNEEARSLLRRFANVFGLAYRRFIDLKHAEAQAHEARIEISLERIRARALAMHKSDELKEVAKVLWEQMALLGQAELEASVVHLYEEDNDNIHSWRAVSIGTDSSSNLTYGHMVIPKNSCEFVREWLTKFYSDQQEYTLELSGDKQIEWYGIMAQLAPEVFNSMRWKQSIDEKRYYRFSKFSGGALLMVSKQEPSVEVGYLQKRAAVVFDLAYRRFLDLQKAEAQAKEAQIEAALEKVRSRSLAMHKSDELQEVINTVFDRLSELNIEAATASILIPNDDYTSTETWIQNAERNYSAAVHVPYFKENGISRDFQKALVNKEDLLSKCYSKKEKDEWFTFLFDKTGLGKIPEERKKYVLAGESYCVSIVHTKHGGIHLGRYINKSFTDEENNILKRFAKVFEQAYIRFLDLQKAEAQAREAQVEAALERVRSKAMAMHKSEDLHSAVATVFEELEKLKLGLLRCGIAILDKEKPRGDIWITIKSDQGNAVQVSGDEPLNIHPLLQGAYDAWLRHEDFSYVLKNEDLHDYYESIARTNFQSLISSNFSIETKDQPQYYFNAVFHEGSLFAFLDAPFTGDAKSIMKRFAGVFNLTYKRFLDLQKAEANAREAQIEAGLERVRARTMAMHTSDDVSIATATMFTELDKLGIQNLRGGITIIRPDQTQEVWSVTNLPDGRVIRAIGVFDMKLHPLWRALFEGRKRKEDYQYYWLAGEDKEKYIAILNATPNYLAQPIKEIPDVHVQSYFFGEGAIWTNSLQPHSEEDKQIMKRFASVFSLTFRRYQDLRKAEAQAREATIEAALERVRGKAMAMHSSKDLTETIAVFYHELEGLSLTPRRCGVGLINEKARTGELSTMSTTSDGQTIELIGTLDLTTHPVLEGVYNNWVTRTEYHPVLRGNEIKEYYKVIRPQIAFPDYPNDSVQYGYFFFFDEGGVYAWTEKELQEDELKIYRRFTSVLSLTYKRYKDLKDAESRAQNAIKEATLDRIRADIASMRTVEDLERITPLIWNELKTLNIPFIRCGVFIMDDDQRLIHTFLSTPDGKAIAAFHLPYDTPGNISKVIDNWRHKKIYTDHWGEEEFIQFAEMLMNQGALGSKEQYLKTIPQGGFYLHFLPFLQGMLYVGNTGKLNEEQIELIQHVADAFSTAYARYEDFNKLEAAKQQVERTLVDLKQAQTQLVQSEKMASLGELTAGIAHEIQNPLNFVNNFSDVSNELLEEMKQELATGNTQQAIDIANDVMDNLDKILHHGKRADAIVKGMLQHSRTSSGQKEMTDINILADEYLRLAYHGLRAKDKSFNAKFETHFDNNIGKVSIIPQDIGRVILNLINNAFYTVTEKKKKNDNGYEPIVTVTTLKDNGRIEIKVKDNGNGIPQKNLDKIFQPFFTTKPTGQGTGLGLSLAYDIITKGHGGKLEVETKEGEGTIFTVQLPAES